MTAEIASTAVSEAPAHNGPAADAPASLLQRLPHTGSDSLRSQDLLVRLLTAGAVLLLFTAVGVALWWGRYKELETTAKLGVREVSRMVDELGRSLELAQRVIADHEARLQRAADAGTAAAMFATVATDQQAIRALLPFPFGVWPLDEKGQVLGPKPGWQQPEADPQTRPPWLTRLPDGGSWHLGPTQGSPGSRVVPLVRRAAPNPHGVAAFVVGLDHAALIQRFERDRMPNSGGAGLFRVLADGSVQVLARAPHAEVELGRKLRGPLAQALSKAPRGTFDALVEIDGSQRLVAYQRLGGDAAGLVLTYGMEKNAVLADWNRSLPLVALVTALLAGGMLWGDRRLRLSLQLLNREREALVRSENQFRTLADNLPDLVMRFDDAGRYLYCNPATQLATGRPANAFIGKTNAEIGARADLVALWHDAFGRVFASGDTERIEFAFQGPLGLRDWEALITREPQLPGQAPSALVIARDITARKQAEDALREREEKLRRSERRYRVATTGTAVWEWDFATGGGMSLDTQFWQRIGREQPTDETIVALFEEAVHPEDLQQLRKVLQGHLRDRTPYQLEFRARHASGEWRWFFTQGQAVWGEDGKSRYMAGTTFEITTRKQAEEALRVAEALQRRVFEQIADGVVVLGADFRIVDANPRAMDMAGYTRDELLGQNVNNLLPASERSRINGALDVVAARNPNAASWNILRKDGSGFSAEVSSRSLGDGRFVLVVRDVTQQRLAEKALRDSQTELSELTRRLLTQEQMSTRRIAQSLHDHLGQTLAAARLNLDACIRNHAAAMPPELVEHSQLIGALLDRTVLEVRQVLTNLRPPYLEEMGLAAALDNELGTRAPVFGQTDVLLEVGEGGFRTCWPSEVAYAAFMVAREAVANARQHARASLIRVTLDGSETSLHLHVIDNGRGVPERLVNGRPGHLGMVGMRERALAINAVFKIEAVPTGGTSIALLWQAEAP